MITGIEDPNLARILKAMKAHLDAYSGNANESERVASQADISAIEIKGLTPLRMAQSDAGGNVISVGNLASWVIGTLNQVTSTASAGGTVTLSLPQDMHTGAVPEFDGLKLDVTEVTTDYTVTEDDTFLIVTERGQETSLDIYPAVEGDDGYSNRTSSFNTHYEYMIIGNVTQEAFIRFPNVAVPNGATIDSAYITLTNHSLSDYGTIDMAVHFNDIDNAVAPTDATEFDGLALTDAVVWPHAIWYTFESYSSPSLISLVQDIVDKEGWSSGNALMAVINRNGSDTGWKYVVSLDYTGGWEPVLHIESSSFPSITVPTTMIADSGRPIFVMKDSSEAGSVNIVTEGSETINGASRISLKNQYDGVMLLPDGTNLQAFFFRTDGIEDGNSIIVDGDPNDNEYAKFTENGLEGRTYAEVRADINVEDGSTADQTKDDIDTLGLSHDSLSDVSTDDHHTRYTDAEADARCDLKIEDGTAQGQIAFWDGTKWVKTETSELFWDDVNKRLGKGTNIPDESLDIEEARPAIRMKETGTSNRVFTMGYTHSAYNVFLNNGSGDIWFQSNMVFDANRSLAFKGVSESDKFHFGYNSTSDTFEFNTDKNIGYGIDILHLSTSGKVGVKTTDPQEDAHVVGTTRLGAQDTNYVEIGDTGDVVLVGGAGIPYGEISAQSNTTTTSLTEDVPAQITIFDTNGASNNATPDHTNDHITITKAGHYYVSCSMTVNSSGGTGALVEFEVMKNNGDSSIIPHQDRTFAGGGGESGCLTLTGIADLAATDTIEVWATNEDNDDDFVVEDICLSAFQIGGT